MNNPLSLAEALPKEIERCREILTTYEEIGDPGRLVSFILREEIKTAEQAILEGDTVTMLKVYTSLLEYSE